MVTPDCKRRLKQKAEECSLSLTGFFEKVATSQIIFIDTNVKRTFSLFDLIPKKSIGIL